MKGMTQLHPSWKLRRTFLDNIFGRDTRSIIDGYCEDELEIEAKQSVKKMRVDDQIISHFYGKRHNPVLLHHRYNIPLGCPWEVTIFEPCVKAFLGHIGLPVNESWVECFTWCENQAFIGYKWPWLPAYAHKHYDVMLRIERPEEYGVKLRSRDSEYKQVTVCPDYRVQAIEHYNKLEREYEREYNLANRDDSEWDEYTPEQMINDAMTMMT